MICFKDMTFCDAPCGTTTCRRRLTEVVFDDAAKWWGSPEAPVAVSDLSSGCPDFTPGNRSVTIVPRPRKESK